LAEWCNSFALAAFTRLALLPDAAPTAAAASTGSASVLPGRVVSASGGSWIQIPSGRVVGILVDGAVLVFTLLALRLRLLHLHILILLHLVPARHTFPNLLLELLLAGQCRLLLLDSAESVAGLLSLFTETRSTRLCTVQNLL
jgi:hypothetical protein